MRNYGYKRSRKTMKAHPLLTGLGLLIVFVALLTTLNGVFLKRPFRTLPIIAPIASLPSILPLGAMSAAILRLPFAQSSPSPVGHAYGIAAGSSLTGLSQSALAARLDGIKATGAKWVRFDFSWADIQPSDSSDYNWQAVDRVVSAANNRGLHILGLLTYTPAWARSSACPGSFACEPANPAQFASFAKAAAARYSSQGVHYWEIWNEPNNPNFWQPGANPGQYTRLLQLTYTALRQQDSAAFIVSGGLSPQPLTATSLPPLDFLAAMYQAGAKGSFDAVGDHPYTFPLSPTSPLDQAWNQMAAPTHSLRALMVGNGDGGKMIWITEFGAPTGGPGAVATLTNPNSSQHPFVVDEPLQAAILSNALTLYRNYSWSGPFLYYSYQDAGTDPSTNENFFGLVRADGSQKPAYAVFSQAANSTY